MCSSDLSAFRDPSIAGTPEYAAAHARVSSKLVEGANGQKLLPNMSQYLPPVRPQGAPGAAPQVGPAGMTPINQPNYNESQNNSHMYASRLNSSVPQLEELLRGKDGKFSTANLPGSWGRMIGESSIAGVGAPEWMVTDEEKKFRRLMNDISTAILRKESGATIGVDEFKRELYKYIPLPNDSPEELARKMESLRISSRALAEGTGRAPTVYPNLFGRQPAPSAPVTATAPGGGQMALPAGTPIYDMAGKRVR